MQDSADRDCYRVCLVVLDGPVVVSVVRVTILAVETFHKIVCVLYHFVSLELELEIKLSTYIIRKYCKCGIVTTVSAV